ncbi:hypothetical protein FB451DRAFT_1387040 [Mycena latifolia]|nr:hypothetical protein FB451DRAFT_1387040 [Mycena latifolia]
MPNDGQYAQGFPVEDYAGWCLALHVPCCYDACLEPPNPEYLRIHASFAQVLHLSGAAELLEELRRDAERMEMLHLNGHVDFGLALASHLAALCGGGVYGKPQHVY